MADKKYRLITRSDFDGLVCAVLLEELNLISEIKFVHPKDMQDGKIEVTENDITTNLPYVAAAHLAFDHHESETVRNVGKKTNYIIDAYAPSAARVVYNYYGGKEKFPNISDDIMQAVDQADSAQYSKEEILEPKGWTFLNFLMDSRTGLGRFRNFRISNYQLMMDLISHCKVLGIDAIMKLPDVQERVELYNKYQPLFKEQLKRCTVIHDNLIVLNLQPEEIIYPGNRFYIYAMYPECNISMHQLWGLNKQNTVFACGKSIINRSSTVNIGELMLEYGGGGHAAAGTCQIDNDKAEAVKQELIAKLNNKKVK